MSGGEKHSAEPVTDAELDEIERLDREATPPPWWQGDTEEHDHGDADTLFAGESDGRPYWLAGPFASPKDARYCERSRALLPRLAAEVRARRADLAREREVNATGAEQRDLLRAEGERLTKEAATLRGDHADWLRAAIEAANAIPLDDLGGTNYGEGTCSTWEDVREEHDDADEDAKEHTQYQMICDGAERVRGAVIAALWGALPKACPKCEAWARAVAEMGKDAIPCGHTVADLIGGTETAPDGSTRPAVTKCGACLALRQEEIKANREPRLSARVCEAIGLILSTELIPGESQPNNDAEHTAAALASRGPAMLRVFQKAGVSSKDVQGALRSGVLDARPRKT